MKVKLWTIFLVVSTIIAAISAYSLIAPDPVWVSALAIALGALGLYAFSKDQPKCPNCSAFVAKNSSRCKKCGAPLGWA